MYLLRPEFFRREYHGAKLVVDNFMSYQMECLLFHSMLLKVHGSVLTLHLLLYQL